MIRDYHQEDKPRERLLQYGAQSLSNQEILALLLRTGSKNESVMVLAKKLLQKLEDFQSIRNATIEEITAIKGIGPAKAIQIFAAIELGRRINKVNYSEKCTVHSPEDCANYLMAEMQFLPQEHFMAVYLNTKNQIIHKQTIFIGSLNMSIVHPREVFREAIRRSAASFICAHNHPSGDPTPSIEDIHITARLAECGKIMGIELLDHIIIGENKFFSLKEEGYI